MSDFLVLQKEVDRSVLSEGMSIPVSFQNLFYERLGFRLSHGESKSITVMIGQNTYDAMLINQPFDTKKYPDHGDVLQIRYSPSQGLAKELRSIFKETTSAVNEYLEKRTDKKKRLVIPTEKKEYVAIYATPVTGVLLFDCITCGEYQEEVSVIKRMDEKILENAIDEKAGIETVFGIKKIRRLSKAVGDNLKIVYGYRCQICGAFIGECYGSHVIHAHHIDYFTHSLNNNVENIMIVCPNHHGIIHDTNPQFDKQKKVYVYPNGFVEGLKLNYHL